MARHTSSPQPPAFLTRNHSLTPPTAALLMKYSIRATDSLGRAVSNSTVLRALLRYAERQDPTWLQDELFPLIKEESSLSRHRYRVSAKATETAN